MTGHDWKPIATAPRDRRILVCEDGVINIARWSDEFIDAHDADWATVSAWVVYDCEDQFYSLKCDPQWWMELPDTP